MGSSGTKIVKAVKYFDEIEINEKSLKNRQNSTVEHLTEKIKLEFSLRNCSSGKIYSINTFFLEDDKNSFTSDEKKPNNSEINFDKMFICDYYFEKEQNMQIIMFKEDDPPVTIVTNLAEIVGSKYSVYTKQMESKEMLIIKAVKLGTGKSYVDINISIKNNNPNDNYLTKNKLIFEINCKNKKIYSSESVSDEGNYARINIPSNLLSPEYKVNICDADSKNIKASYSKLIESLKAQKYNNTNNNNLQLKIPISKTISLSIYDNSVFEENISFFDLISSGVRLNLSIGIDFTGSNGHPLDQNTLHCIINDGPNDYEKVIKSIGNILSNYNYKKLYPAYGFGAIINSSPYNEVSMCFNINFKEYPEINTINGVIDVYRACLEKLTFAGPTYFAPIIKKVIETIRLRDNNLEYNILLILTDGVIDDIQDTIDALVEGSFLPLSVIIVGIGDADFSKMVVLDGNEIPLVSSQNIKWLRDLVQFIQYNKYKNNEQRLTKEILEEIPRQIVEYYTLNNYNPEKIRDIARKNSFQNNQININNNQNILKNNSFDLPSKSQIEINKKFINNINNNNNNYNQYNNYNNNNIPNKYDDINLSNNINNNYPNEYNNINLNNNNYNNNRYNNINLNNNNNYNNNVSKKDENINLNPIFKDVDLDAMPICETVVIGNNNNNNNTQENNNNNKKDSFNEFNLFSNK